MLIINNRFLSLYDYNFLLVIEKIRKYKMNEFVMIFTEIKNPGTLGYILVIEAPSWVYS